MGQYGANRFSHKTSILPKVLIVKWTKSQGSKKAVSAAIQVLVEEPKLKKIHDLYVS